MDGRRYLDQMIAEHFTDARGEAQLYVGRQSVLPGLAGWPIPHDAPYKPQLDRLMMRILEVCLLLLMWLRLILYNAVLADIS